jgi:hypothetical protein
VDVKAQAVIMDALFLMILCSIASTMLLWASSTYGNNSFKAYYFMYMGEFNNALVNSLSGLKYADQNDVDRFWLVEVGAYMMGEFEQEDSEGNMDPRYYDLMKQWYTICLHSEHPVELVIFSTDETVKYGTPAEPVYFSCPMAMLDPGGRSVTTWVYEYETAGCPKKDGEPTLCNPPPPYFSSGIQRKICGKVPCTMEAKIYY